VPNPVLKGGKNVDKAGKEKEEEIEMAKEGKKKKQGRSAIGPQWDRPP
jgi:hypothetical protein